MQALLYEYEEDLEDLLSYWLQREEFTLTIASSREEFFELCRQDYPPLLLLGTCPPGVAQSEVVDQIRAIAEVRASHIMILTTNPGFCQQINATHDELLTCVCTPLPPKTLRSTLRKIRQEHESIPEV